MRPNERIIQKRLERRELHDQPETPYIVFLDSPITVKDSLNNDIVVSVIEIEYVVDIASNKVVDAYAKKIGKINLWKNQSYDDIGDWTNADLTNRIKEIYR
jgi:hypothetical protein